MVSDGWENACKFLEIFDTSGEFIDAVAIQGETLSWRDCPFAGDDFPTPALLWADRENGESNPPPMWSKATATQVEQNGNLTRLFFYFDE